MAVKSSRRLVIDASVARAAGSIDAVFPTSKNCRDFLEAVLRICHRMVLTEDILAEWHKHQSRPARRWLRSMFARKKVEKPDSLARQELRDKIIRTAQTTKGQAAMRKDVHLIEAALTSDGLVVALDETVRELFSIASKSVGEIENIIWVNPDKEDEKSMLWLETGARSEKHRRLGAKN